MKRLLGTLYVKHGNWNLPSDGQISKPRGTMHVWQPTGPVVPSLPRKKGF